MVASELLAELHKLARAEKFPVVQILVGELAMEDVTLPPPEKTHPIYTPLGNEAAANALLAALQAAETEDRATRG
jgi:hypothetical protein